MPRILCPFDELGRDGFHSVRDFSDKDADAVERLPTGFVVPRRVRISEAFYERVHPMRRAKAVEARHEFGKQPDLISRRAHLGSLE